MLKRFSLLQFINLAIYFVKSKPKGNRLLFFFLKPYLRICVFLKLILQREGERNIRKEGEREQREKETLISCFLYPSWLGIKSPTYYSVCLDQEYNQKIRDNTPANWLIWSKLCFDISEQFSILCLHIEIIIGKIFTWAYI